MVKILLSFVFASYAFGAAPEIAAILKKGELHVGVMSDDRWPFFYTEKDATLRGIDVEVAKGFAESLGVKLKITRESTGFKNTLAAVEAGKVDMALSAFYPTVGRALSVNFSEPYCKLKGVFVTKRAPKKASKKKIFATFDSTLFDSSLRNRFPTAQVFTFNKRKEMWDALRSEKVDTLYADDLEIVKAKGEDRDFDLYFKVEKDVESSFPIAAALSFKKKELLALLNLWIKNEEAMGNLKRLCAIGAKK